MDQSIYDLLLKQGFIIMPTGDNNLIRADKAFFGYRVMEWVRQKSKEPGFNLQPYLVALTYYKLDMADLKFEENELLYRYKGMQLEGTEHESSQDTNKVSSEFYRPGEEPPRSP
jgi:hypothetical protein